MRTALTAALLLGLVSASPARADVFLADFVGYDWTWPIPSCLDCPGNYYEAHGFMGPVNPTYLVLNTTDNEYTFALGVDLFFSDADTFGTTVVAHFVNGQINFYGDDKTTGTLAEYNRDTFCDPFYDRLAFVDGDNILSGVFTSMDIVFDTVSGNGNLAGLTDWVGGSQIGNIPVPQRTGWTFGSIGLNTPQTPCGYHWQIDGECYLAEPVPVQKSTWGSIKSKFGEIR